MRAFRYFITKTVTPGNNSRGDFIRDVRMDRDMPIAREWPKMKAYLVNDCNAMPEAVLAGAKLWREYLRWRRQNS